MDIFEKVKDRVQIADVVEHYGLKLNSRDKVCCPFHREKTPSFSIDRNNNIFTCFGCGETGDAIAFVGKLKNLEPLDAAKELAEIFRIDVAEKKAPKKPKKEPSTAASKPAVTEYIKTCMTDAGKTDYFAKRGLTEETVKKYCLGFDVKRNAVVIPYSSKLTYYQTRSVETKAFFKPKTEDAGAEPLFNRSALWQTRQAIFIVESPICALSIMQSGFAAVSLCGVGGANKLVRDCKEKPPTGTLVLCLDNDEPGQTASKDLETQLGGLGIKFDVFNIAGECKDPNELLMKNPDELKVNLAAARKHAKAKYRTDKDSITAYELQATKITAPNWIVEDVLPEGLAIICAPSKTGKSWMMLQLSVAVCGGQEFLDFKTKTGDCLYYALEDSKFRLQDRMNKLLKEAAAPKNLHLAIRADPLDGGLLDRIAGEIAEYPNIRLVIIDTLQKVRGRTNRTETTYTSDYREMSILKDFADKHNICLLMVHHLRKMGDENDVFNMISGSNGIMGACDTIFILSKKKRGDENATLSMTGRDIRQCDLVVRFDSEKYRWEVVGTAEEEERKRKKREYSDNPIVRTVKELTINPPFAWKGTATELMKAVFDVTGKPCPYSSVGLGKAIREIESQLYYDGIEHTVKRSGESRTHCFSKRREHNGYRQGYLFEEKGEKETP